MQTLRCQSVLTAQLSHNQNIGGGHLKTSGIAMDDVEYEVLDVDVYALRQMTDEGPQCIIVSGDAGRRMTLCLNLLLGLGWETRGDEKNTPKGPEAPEGSNVLLLEDLRAFNTAERAAA